MQKVGFILFMLGAGGMDNPNMAVPAVMVLSGLGILAVSVFINKIWLTIVNQKNILWTIRLTVVNL